MWESKKVTAQDIEYARRAYANSVLLGMDSDTVSKARGWLEWLVERAREQQ